MRSRPTARSRALLFLLASLAACKVDVQVPQGAQLSCATDADCPDGWICRSTLDRCVRPGGDGTAPQLVTSSLAIAPARVGLATATMTVAFEVSEALAGDPAASLRLSGTDAAARTLTLQARDEAAHWYSFSYAPVPGSDAEGDVSLVATFIDAAGNEGRADLPRVAVFDFTPPALALDTGGAPVAAVTLTPPATSPLRDPSAVTVGTRLRVDFAASETLAGGASSPVVRLGSGGSALTLTQLSGNGLSFVYEATVGAGLPEGPAPLTAHLTDLAGNGTDVALGTVEVKTQRPASPAVDASGTILFHRVPWGSEATGGAETYTLRGLAGAVSANALAVVYSAPTVISAAGALVGREIARIAADGTGAFGGDVGDASPFQLYMGDAPDVYVAAVDAAGNVSDADGDPSNGVQAALVRDVAWTATMNGKIPGRVFPNPHAFEERQIWTPTLAQRGSKPAAVPAEVGRQDGTQASVRGAPFWLPARRYSPLGYRAGAGIAHDPVRGCRVAFGGESWDGCDSGFYCSQWESCRGSPWRLPAIDDPEGDGNPTLGSGRPLLFAGGRGASVLSDGTELWEWDGASWRKLAMSDPEGDGNPQARRDHAIAYDEARQRLVLFGGVATAGGAVLDDAWETDFRSWRRVCTVAPCTTTRPAARSEHTMVYDSARKVTVLVGGALSNGTSFDAATWTWNGSAWTRCATTACGGASTSPAQRRSAGLAFDPARGRAVAFGGITSGGYDGAVFEWNGTAWTALCTGAPCNATKPAARAHASLFYDGERGRTVLFGGEVGGFGVVPECFSNWCGTEWEWSGTAWTEVLATPAPPPSVSGATPVYDPIRDHVVLFGGYANTGTYSSATWLWDGGESEWAVQAPGTVPAGRRDHGAAWSQVGGYVAMAGGYNGAAVGSTYSWNGTNWTSRSAVPSARSRTALATSFYGALLFGGLDGSGTELCDTLELLSGGTWWSWATCSASNPPARAGHAMVRATGWAGQPVVLVGGADGITAMNDVWHWASNAWTQMSAGGAASATRPAPRTGHGLFFDTGRNRVLLWGGGPAGAVSNYNCVDDYGGLACHDFWEWSGSAWTRVFPVDLYGDGSPDPYRLEGVAFDTLREAGVGVETNAGTGATLDTWWWHGGPKDRPGQVMSVVFDAAEVRRPFDVLDLDVTWVGGASGAPSGTVVNGAYLDVWDNREWRPLVYSSTASPGSPQALHWSLSTDLTFGSTPLPERQRFMVGDQRVLNFALRPGYKTGSADGFGQVSTDYAEVTVRYRLAAP